MVAYDAEDVGFGFPGNSQPDLEKGVAAIREVWKTLPRRPGVYRMQDARGDVPLTYFEFGTLAALWLFSRARLDVDCRVPPEQGEEHARRRIAEVLGEDGYEVRFGETVHVLNNYYSNVMTGALAALVSSSMAG